MKAFVILGKKGIVSSILLFGEYCVSYYSVSALACLFLLLIPVHAYTTIRQCTIRLYRSRVGIPG